jgi:spectinomycin phosphotransferase/16S rRNA (guanine(1405)-N(7))-methyltransferase
VLTPPAGLSQELLASVLATRWGLEAKHVRYRAVGWGSHHWEVTDQAGGPWFVRADELHNKRVSPRETLDAAYDRLRCALAAAVELHASGCGFVVAPVPAAGGQPLARAGEDFAVALYPFVAGQSFEWGEFSSQEHRDAVLDLVLAVHAAPAARDLALADRYLVPLRDDLEAALGRAPAGSREAGPLTGPMARLLRANEVAILQLLRRYDELVARATAMPAHAVLTHGEPHRANTMLTSDGWRLIDWDTALVAPPERDLWVLDPGDGSLLGRYAAATGVQPRPALLELYRVRWDVADLAMDVSRFRRPHAGTPEDEEAWQLLCDLVAQISA